LGHGNKIPQKKSIKQQCKQENTKDEKQEEQLEKRGERIQTRRALVGTCWSGKGPFREKGLTEKQPHRRGNTYQHEIDSTRGIGKAVFGLKKYPKEEKKWDWNTVHKKTNPCRKRMERGGWVHKEKVDKPAKKGKEVGLLKITNRKKKVGVNSNSDLVSVLRGSTS